MNDATNKERDFLPDLLRKEAAKVREEMASVDTDAALNDFKRRLRQRRAQQRQALLIEESLAGGSGKAAAALAQLLADRVNGDGVALVRTKPDHFMVLWFTAAALSAGDLGSGCAAGMEKRYLRLMKRAFSRIAEERSTLPNLLILDQRNTGRVDRGSRRTPPTVVVGSTDAAPVEEYFFSQLLYPTVLPAEKTRRASCVAKDGLASKPMLADLQLPIPLALYAGNTGRCSLPLQWGAHHAVAVGDCLAKLQVVGESDSPLRQFWNETWHQLNLTSLCSRHQRSDAPDPWDWELPALDAVELVDGRDYELRYGDLSAGFETELEALLDDPGLQEEFV